MPGRLLMLGRFRHTSDSPNQFPKKLLKMFFVLMPNSAKRSPGICDT